MYLYIALVVALAFAVVFFLIMQVVIPLYKGTTVLPIFRADPALKRELAEKQRELEELAEKVSVQSQIDELNRRKAEMEQK